MKGFSYISSGISLAYDREKCIGCGYCASVCPHAVFSVEENKALLGDKTKCMECGACAKNCPVAAISVNSGVGCAAAVITGFLRKTEPTCDCSGGSCTPSLKKKKTDANHAGKKDSALVSHMNGKAHGTLDAATVAQALKKSK